MEQAKNKMTPKQKERDRIRKLFLAEWNKKVATFDSPQDAINAGFSYQAVAVELNVSRARIANQFNGSNGTSIGAALKEHLIKMLDIDPEKVDPRPLALPSRKPSKQYKKSQLAASRNQQLKIQKQVNDGEIRRISAVLLDSDDEIAAWDKLLASGESKSAIIRRLILQSAA